MDKTIDLINSLIANHIDNNSCMNWQDVLDCEDVSDCEKGLQLAYEVGKYNAYKEVIQAILRQTKRRSNGCI